MTPPRILVLARSYPSQHDLYASAFVHVRVKAYMRHAPVVVASAPNPAPDWEYEGVPVRTFATMSELSRFIDEYRPDVIAAHFAEGAVIDDVLMRTHVPVVVWVHGYEALGWYRRLFNVGSAKELWDAARLNRYQMSRFRGLIRRSNETGRIAFVFVSNWMRRITQTDTFVRADHAFIIPNPIDTSLFRFVRKSADDRFKVLLIRPFHTRKYANDLAIKAILKLARRPGFDRFRFSLYGQGRFFKPLVSRVRHLDNVHAHEGFLTQGQVAQVHRDHGVLLCPTRQDSQGVSMCEAMSSGLVPVTSRNTAIPEFVSDGVSGIMTRSTDGLARAIARLGDDPTLFCRLSQNASESIRAKCDSEGVIAQELELLGHYASA